MGKKFNTTSTNLSLSTRFNVPVVNIRKVPSETAEVVSQGIIGEKATILDEKDSWSFVQTNDQYVGWVPSNVLNKSDLFPNQFVLRLAAHIYKDKDIISGPILTLPFGTGLEEVDSSDPKWVEVLIESRRSLFIRKGDIGIPSPLRKRDLGPFAMQFLGIPYTWGGRSSFGFDCSGFVQMLYKQIGVLLPRDTKDQIQDPRLQNIAQKESTPGDLIFWGNRKGQICHVGLSLGGDSFIHTSNSENKPWLRVSSLNDPQWNPDISSEYLSRFFIQLSSSSS